MGIGKGVYTALVMFVLILLPLSLAASPNNKPSGEGSVYYVYCASSLFAFVVSTWVLEIPLLALPSQFRLLLFLVVAALKFAQLKLRMLKVSSFSSSTESLF